MRDIGSDIDILDGHFRSVRVQRGVIIDVFMDEGAFHREDGPAYIESDPETGERRAERYYRHGVLHRDGDAPAYTYWNADGSLHMRGWYKNGIADRDPRLGPAIETFHSNGVVAQAEFLVGGESHRDPKMGPAVIIQNADGSLSREYYFVKGRQLGETTGNRLPVAADACEAEIEMSGPAEPGDRKIIRFQRLAR